MQIVVVIHHVKKGAVAQLIVAHGHKGHAVINKRLAAAQPNGLLLHLWQCGEHECLSPECKVVTGCPVYRHGRRHTHAYSAVTHVSTAVFQLAHRQFLACAVCSIYHPAALHACSPLCGQLFHGSVLVLRTHKRHRVVDLYCDLEFNRFQILFLSVFIHLLRKALRIVGIAFIAA